MEGVEWLKYVRLIILAPNQSETQLEIIILYYEMNTITIAVLEIM